MLRRNILFTAPISLLCFLIGLTLGLLTASGETVIVPVKVAAATGTAMMETSFASFLDEQSVYELPNYESKIVGKVTAHKSFEVIGKSPGDGRMAYIQYFNEEGEWIKGWVGFETSHEKWLRIPVVTPIVSPQPPTP